MYQDILYIYC